jgi:hypothetical protein
MTRKLFTVLCFAFLLSPVFLWGEETAKIGDVSLSVPPPTGFVRYDGLNQKIDDVMVQMVPKTNRLLMLLATPKDAASAKKGKPEDLERYMMLQTFRNGEKMVMTAKDFTEVLKGVEKEFGSGDKAAAQLEAEVNEQLKKTKDVSDLKLGQTVMLGVFHKSERSIDMGMLMKAQVGDDEPKPMAAAFSIAMVRGKILYIYVYSGYYSPEDIAWTRKTVKDWREAIVAANKE